MQFSMISILHEDILKLFLLNRQAISDKNVLFFLDIQTSFNAKPGTQRTDSVNLTGSACTKRITCLTSCWQR